MIKTLKVGGLTLKNNLLLAPLSGYSDYAFRDICYSCGAGLCFTEMVSAKGLLYNSKGTVDLLKTTDADYIKAVQLFGSDSKIMRSAIEDERLKDFQIIDINMGCPVPKVFNNNEGSHLLLDLDLAQDIVKECVKTGKIITVKMRLGVGVDDFVASELAKRLEGEGAKMITVHGRFRDELYSGNIHYDLIKKVIDSVKIPVIANGNCFEKEDISPLFDTGASGIMLARGAMRKPWLFSEILGLPIKDKRSLIKRHIDLLLASQPDEYVAKYFRKQMAFYLTGIKNNKKYKERVFTATNTQTIKDIVDELDF